MSKDILSLVNFVEKYPKNNCLLENVIQNKKKLEKSWCHHHIEKSRNVSHMKIIECISSINLKLRLVT